MGYFGEAKPIEYFRDISLPIDKLATLLASRIELSQSEEEAINFAANEGEKLPPGKLTKQLKEQFGIVNAAAFFQRVSVSRVQKIIAVLLSSQAVSEAEALNNSTPTNELRLLFNSDGTLKPGINTDLLHWTLNGRNDLFK